MQLADREYCTGCAACVNVCVQNAIVMRSDDEGFLQPQIVSDKCVSCGMCERVCPIIIGPEFRPEQIEKTPLCGISKDIEVWKASTSGGAFTEICNVCADKNPVVFGARYSSCDKVEIGCVETVEEIGVFRKSKYVQAEMGNSLRQCREHLRSKRFVIFSGTPCQIAGLRSFLGEDYKNLLTVEFICHGVGSPKVFSDCIRAMSFHPFWKIVKYGFRCKRNWPTTNEHSSLHELRLLNFLTIVRVVVVDVYNRLFLNQLCLRRSCMEHCRFRTSERYADITIADCRAERELYPNKDDKNWSVIVANTQKGREAIAHLGDRMKLYAYSVDLLRRTNPLYYRTTPGNPNRSELFRRWKSGESIIRIAKQMVPDVRDHWVKSFVLRCLRYARRRTLSFIGR